jgi:predicted ATPase with chaperone activity
MNTGADTILRNKQEQANASNQEQSFLLANKFAAANPSAVYRYKSHADALNDYVEEDVVERLHRKAKESEELNKIAKKVYYTNVDNYIWFERFSLFRLADIERRGISRLHLPARY